MKIRKFLDTIRYVWTAKNDSNTLRVDAKIFISAKKYLRKKKFLDTCGHGQKTNNLVSLQNIASAWCSSECYSTHLFFGKDNQKRRTIPWFDLQLPWQKSKLSELCSFLLKIFQEFVCVIKPQVIVREISLF